jgi:nucleosome binding factor SPN SPT16 subunit
MKSAVIVMGKTREDALRPYTSDFFLWLLNYEFADTIMGISEKNIVFALSPKKAKIMRTMEAPSGYSGPKLQLIEYDIKNDYVATVVKKFVKTGVLSPGQVGVFQKDKEDGNITKITLEAIEEFNEVTDMQEMLSNV